MKKILVIFLSLQLFIIPVSIHAQETKVEVSQPKKSLESELSFEKEPKQSPEKEADYRDPANYPLIQEGGSVDYLFDSYYQNHYIYFEDITTSIYDENDMKIRLLYSSDDAYAKERIVTVEFFKEENNSLTYQGNTENDTYGDTLVYLDSFLTKSTYNDQPYIYIRLGISKTSYDEYYSDFITFKVDNPFYSSSNETTDEKYAVISNESKDGSTTQSTGTFNLNNMKYTMDESLPDAVYKIDVNKPFDIISNKGKLIQKSTKFFTQLYKVGDTKDFWVTNLSNGWDYQINARLAYSGSNSSIWVYDNQITDIDAKKMGQEFDQRIYPSVTNNFGLASDVDQDGKINILCFDIQDGFSGSGGYTAGYFWSGDLYNVTHSNQSEIFYIDTYPAMGSYTKDVSRAYATLAHEFQHMVNFNQNVLIEGSYSNMDTWLNESLSMAAEQVYSGQGLSNRINYYNFSSSIQNGHSLLYWDHYGDTLSNYSLSYLFGQYIKIQANQGDRIFKEILTDPNNDYKAVETVAKKYIDPNMTFGKLMTNFRIALLLKEPTGLYGFKGDPFFDSLEEKVFTGNTANLRGGGAVVTTYNSAEGLEMPSDKGQDITYTLLGEEQGGEEVDSIPPANPFVNEVGDSDSQITGITESNTTVYAMVGQNEIGRTTASDSGDFFINISPQQAGANIEVFAVDTSGNVSAGTQVTVVDKTAPIAPVVNKVTDQSTVVTGTAEKGSEVTVTIGDESWTGTVDQEGKFSVTIPKQQAGTIIEVTARDGAGNVSAVTKVTVEDKTAPTVPTVNNITDLDTELTGTADPNATVISKVSGNEIGRSTADSNGNYTITINKQTADSIIEVIAIDAAGNTSNPAKVQVSDQQPAVEKLIGENRYSTAEKVSQLGWSTSETVFLVNGGAIADGLTATPLASTYDAPILLTTKDTVLQETMDEIKRLKAKKVVLIGGTGVISANVENTLKSNGLTVSRIGGENRYETSLMIAKELDKLIDVQTVYMAYGLGEPDALSIAAQAGQTKQPIILTDKQSVPTETYDWLKGESLKTSYFIGGQSVIKPEIMNEMNKITTQDVSNNRLSGENRQETNAKVIEAFYPQSEMETILVAHSDTSKLVDALSAGPLAAKFKVPVLLVSNYGLDNTQISAIETKQTSHVHQIGGGIGASILDQIVDLMN